MATTNLRSRLVLAILVIAAGASVATSYIESWEAGEFVDGAPFVLSQERSEARIALQAEANPDCFGPATTFATLDITVELSALDEGPGTVHPEVAVRIERTGDDGVQVLAEQGFALAFDEEPLTWTFDAAEVFDDCEDGAACTRTVQLVLEHTLGAVVYVDWAANVWIGGPIEQAPEDPQAALVVLEQPVEGGAP